MNERSSGQTTGSSSEFQVIRIPGYPNLWFSVMAEGLYLSFCVLQD